jgi:hypothetical protein
MEGSHLFYGMQCGCECLECTVTDPTGTTYASADPSVCNNVLAQDTGGQKVSCTLRNEDNCGAQFSEPENVRWCAIEQPSQWSPVFDLSKAINWTATGHEDAGDDTDDADDADDAESSGPDNETEWSKPIVTSTRVLYTGNSPFGDAAMQRFVRVPELELLSIDADIAAEVEVWSEMLLLDFVTATFKMLLLDFWTARIPFHPPWQP